MHLTNIAILKVNNLAIFIFLRYIAAVLQGHVEPEFPYISDDATYSPESCVFGQLINMGSVLCKYSILQIISY